MSAERFVEDFIAKLRAKSRELRQYGASASARACQRIAQDLDEEFHNWWLAGLSVGEAANESGYSPERLREMARDGTIPHRKGTGKKGHLVIARRDLPRRPRAIESEESSLEERLLNPRYLQKPA